jgi:hypothetical protein
MKSILSSLPKFQFSSLLAPIGVKQQLAQELRRFLWQGGKSNSKRFHLVNWSIVRVPKSHGGLGIKDHSLMNLAMGDKLLWRLISGKYDLWKKIIHKKIFRGTYEKMFG